MYSDMDKIHDGIGSKLAILIQNMSTFFGGFLVAFVVEWRLTLFLIVFIPLLAFAGILLSKVRLAAKMNEVSQTEHLQV